MTSHRRATGRISSRVSRRLFLAVRGVLAVLALAALLAGIPLVLLALGADPRTVRLPTLDRVRQLLTSPDDGTLLLAAVRVVAWAAWVVLVLSVLVEIKAAVTRRTAPTLRGLGAVQQPAAYLIATITAALATSTAATAAPPAQTATHGAAVPGPPPAASPGVGPRSDPHTSARSAGAAPAADSVLGWGADRNGQVTEPTRTAGGLPVVGVGRYDSLWRIAEKHLGDGHRWSEIYRLNTDRPQPGGDKLTNPDTIREGWTLLLPADATGTTDRDGRAGGSAASSTATGGGADHVIIVRAGDTLSRLAERHLGTAGATQALYDANTRRLQPDGGRLTDPDLLRPGWQLVLPAPDRNGPPAPPHSPGSPHRTAPHTEPDPPAPAPTTTPAPTTPAPTTASAPGTPAAPSATGSVPPSPATSSSPDGAASTTPTAGRASSPASTNAPPGPSTSPTTRGQSDPSDRDSDRWVRLPSGSVLGLGLAATVTGLLALVRRRRRQHRIPGDPTTGEPPQPPLPAAAEAIETALLAAHRRTHHLEGLDSDDTDGDYFTDGDEALNDDEVLGDDRGDEGHVVAASDDLGNLHPTGRHVGDDIHLTDGSTGEIDLGDIDFDDTAAAEAGLNESPLVLTTDPAPVDSVAVVSMSRGQAVGGEPAPTLLALTGPPSAAALAEAAWSGGVGLIGPGAAGAARAVLARLLTATGPMGGVLLTTEDTLAELLPAGAVEGFSVIPGVTVFPTLAAALTAADAELLGRNRRLDDAGVDTLTDYRQLPDGEPVPAVLLLADAPATPGLTARAAAGLNLGRDRELGAVWLGAWPPATIHVTTTGALADADAGSPVGQAENLLPADTADLLTALLPGVRDALDVLDPTTLVAHTDHAATALDDDAVDDGTAAGAAAVAPAGLTAGGDGDRWALGGSAVLEVAVLGRVRVTVVGGGEVTGLRAKVRELLALLAVHPDGLSTDQISEALWPEAPPGRASNRLSPILAQTRRLLREATHLNGDPTASPSTGSTADPDQDPNSRSTSAVDLVPLTDGRYRLHPVLLDTDYRRFTAALTAAADARTSSGAGADVGGPAYRAALQGAAQLYRGEPFDGSGYSWAEPSREALRRQATDALAALAESLTPDSDDDRISGPGGRAVSQPDGPDTDPVEALTALERGIEVDPYNEELYRRIMRLHAAAGRRDAVRRTLRLLEARLIDLDTDPDPATLALATDLLRPRSRTGAGRIPRTRT